MGRWKGRKTRRGKPSPLAGIGSDTDRPSQSWQHPSRKTRVRDPAWSRTHEKTMSTHAGGGRGVCVSYPGRSIRAGAEIPAPHARRPAEQAGSAGRRRRKSRGGRSDGKGLHPANAEALRVLLPENAQHGIVDFGNCDLAADGSVWTGGAIQPEPV